ncbi:hypothetical protein [Luteimonas fraxinea]|uniref:hypothetical protein n=1 Tax=Luteimonas fraxinea TaxID=2901869 RepID=UPI001E3096A3|nr:hypothetical protein [Luteimonas fraxinea]MCD9126010.1 hypothetical protein [Luteimonas fraxinea]
MTPRNRLASQIYQRLIFKDLEAALENPMPAAHRALLLADAFVICAAPTTPGSSETFSLQFEFGSGSNEKECELHVQAQRVAPGRSKRTRAN